MDPIVCPSFTAFHCYLPTECTTPWGFFKSNVKNKHEQKTCSHHNKYNILKKENKKIQQWVKMEFRMCLSCFLIVCLFVFSVYMYFLNDKIFFIYMYLLWNREIYQDDSLGKCNKSLWWLSFLLSSLRFNTDRADILHGHGGVKFR